MSVRTYDGDRPLSDGPTDRPTDSDITDALRTVVASRQRDFQAKADLARPDGSGDVDRFNAGKTRRRSVVGHSLKDPHSRIERWISWACNIWWFDLAATFGFVGVLVSIKVWAGLSQ